MHHRNQFDVSNIRDVLYLVKAEYRAPLRALWESCNNLNSAPKVELVERYLTDYHSTTTASQEGGGDGGSVTNCAVGKGGSRKKGSISLSMEGSANKKTAIQLQREKLEVRFEIDVQT